MPENLVNLETVTVTVPGDASRVLLDAVSLGVSAGERIGVVGLNGGGKTTLLEVFTGIRAPGPHRQATVRIKAAEALIAGVPPSRNQPEPLSFATRRLGRTVLGLEDATLAVSAGRRFVRGPSCGFGLSLARCGGTEGSLGVP